MIKPYHLLLTILLTSGIWLLVITCTNSKEELPDPEIHLLEEEMTWRDLSEKKTTKRIENLVKDSARIAKENVKLKTIIANQSEAKLKEHRENVPILSNAKDTIGYLKQDTTLCDQALADSKKLAAGLTIEVMTDEAIIKGQGELIDSLQEDKKDLLKVDSLNQIDKKKLRKANRKKFFKGLGIGGVIGVIVALFI